MKREIFIEIAAYALFMLFAYASINKLIAYDIFVADLKRSPLLGRFATILSIFIPAIELLICGLLLVGRTRKIGFIASAALMLSFTVYVWYVLSFTKDKPCSCGGIIRNLSWQNHLIFNVAFLLIAITGAIVYFRKHKTNYA